MFRVKGGRKIWGCKEMQKTVHVPKPFNDCPILCLFIWPVSKHKYMPTLIYIQGPCFFSNFHELFRFVSAWKRLYSTIAIQNNSNEIYRYSIWKGIPIFSWQNTVLDVILINLRLFHVRIYEGIHQIWRRAQNSFEKIDIHSRK